MYICMCVCVYNCAYLHIYVCIYKINWLILFWLQMREIQFRLAYAKKNNWGWRKVENR